MTLILRLREYFRILSLNMETRGNDITNNIEKLINLYMHWYLTKLEYSSKSHLLFWSQNNKNGVVYND